VAVSQTTVPISSELTPWLWPLAGVLILLAVVLGGLLLPRAVQAREGQKWVSAHVQAVAGAAFDTAVEVMQSRADHLPPTCVVRLEPHADSGTQVLEEVGR
jgi:hypothetical protein